MNIIEVADRLPDWLVSLVITISRRAQRGAIFLPDTNNGGPTYLLSHVIMNKVTWATIDELLTVYTKRSYTDWFSISFNLD